MRAYLIRYASLTIAGLGAIGLTLAFGGLYLPAAIVFAAVLYVGMVRPFPAGKEWHRWFGGICAVLLILALLYSIYDPPEPLFRF